jgi:hypothetical protein
MCWSYLHHSSWVLLPTMWFDIFSEFTGAPVVLHRYAANVLRPDSNQ